jgi:crotonobetainyl-CoA:carnitine CoA-transferase CaiB-like acyl-CoA transferase
MVLADLGADVTKIERPEVGDDTRNWGPPYDEHGVATYFSAVNRNKTSIALDLNAPADLERAREIVGDSDVLFENFRPGVMQRLGLGYEAVRVDNPGLVYCSVTGFGPRRGAEWPGYDLLLQALGGLMSVTGEPDGPPQKVGVALVDVICGLFAAVGVLAALRHRERTGQGQAVEVNLLSSLLAALVNQASAYTLANVIGTRLGNAHPSIAPYELLRTLDGDLVLAVGNDRQFASLCAAIGRPGIARDVRFESNSARVRNRVELRTALELALRTRPASEWTTELMAVGVPAGQVNDIADAFALAQRLGLDPIVEVPRPTGGTARLVRNPVDLSETPVSYRIAPPDLP